MIDEIIIDDRHIVPGQNAILKIDIARLPSGTDIDLTVHVYRSPNPGPTILVLSGMHGDEINGVEIVRRSIASDLFESLTSGSVIVIPILNIYGFIHFSRVVPDGKDVNRSFPGSRNGSLASRVAHTLTTKILPFVDIILDFHTGGASRYNYPQIRYTVGHQASQTLAKVFAAPYLIRNKTLEKSLRYTAIERNIPTLVYEGGESLRFDLLSINTALAGLKRVLVHQQMLEEEATKPLTNSILFTKTTWIRARRSGLFLWHKSSGTTIKEGEQIGAIHDPNGKETIPILATINAHIIGHNNAPVVSQGDALFHIAYEIES